MSDLEKVIENLQIAYTYSNVDENNTLVPQQIVLDAISLLKAQEPKILTKEDFVNADDSGYIPAWCEEKNGNQYWECVTDTVLAYKDFGMEYGHYRYWTSRPTDEQRKAVKWG